MSEELIRGWCWRINDVLEGAIWAVALAVLLWRHWSITRRWFVGSVLTVVIYSQYSLLIAVAPELFSGRTTLGNYNLTLADALPALGGCLLGHLLANWALRRVERQARAPTT